MFMDDQDMNTGVDGGTPTEDTTTEEAAPEAGTEEAAHESEPGI